MKQDILFHCHFFKNAGSSIDWALRRSFGTEFYENKKHFYSVLDWNEHLIDLVRGQTVAALSSHIFSLRQIEIESVRFSLIALVRHPIERVTSVAAYEKKQNYRNSLGTITDSEISLRGYVDAYLQDGTPASIRNLHTLRFAGRDNGRPLTDDDFAIAVSTLEQCPTIGLVEYFDESMVLFEEILQPRFPMLDLAYIIQNVYQAPRAIDGRIHELKTQLGDELFARLLAKNAMDLKLYDLVKVRFQERIRMIPDFTLKLKRFRERCSGLAESVTS